MAEKREWPSAEKLARLKWAGITPRSDHVGRFSAMAGFLGGIALVWPDLMASLLTAANLVSHVDTGTDLMAEFSPAAARFVGAVLSIVFATAASVFVAGLVQTKFLFRFGLLGFDVRRSVGIAGWQERSWFGALLGLMFFLLFSVGAGAACGWLLLYDWLSVFNWPADRAAVIPRELIARVLPLAVGGLAAFMMIFMFTDRLRFRIRHRMTKSEVEQEARG